MRPFHDVVDCPVCGTANDRFVNPDRCWDCKTPWGAVEVGA